LPPGATIEDAILQGFFELIERDAVAIWFYNKIARPRVDLARVADPYVHEVRRRLDSLGRELWIVDITHDFGIPVYVALARRRDRQPCDEILVGFGCHADGTIALARAVTELVQLGGPLCDPARKDTEADWEQLWGVDTARWLKSATLETQGFLLGTDDERPGPALRPRPPSVAEEVKRASRRVPNAALISSSRTALQRTSACPPSASPSRGFATSGGGSVLADSTTCRSPSDGCRSPGAKSI
jgi:ribosomal protein S12 methylthiotransferase accessory factor